MLGKRTRPFWKTSKKSGHMDYTSMASAINFPSLSANADQEGPKSPKSPLEIKNSSNSMKSPKGWQKKDSEGVGLGILAAMNGSSSSRNPVIASKASISAIQAIPTKNFPASEPIPIVSAMASTRFMDTMIESELSESYTCVIAHCGSNSVRKLEYFHQRNGEEAVGKQRISNSTAFFYSPPKFQGDSFHSDDFLNSCNLCKKMLHGQDIYMYRGDTAFCSVECRNQQIVKDEYKERCVPDAMVKPTECSGSPCSAPRLFYAGVVVA